MAYPAEQALPNDGAWGSADRGRQRPSCAPAYLGTNAHCPSLPPPKQTGGSRGTLLQPDLKAPCMGTIPFLPSANNYQVELCVHPQGVQQVSKTRYGHVPTCCGFRPGVL